MALQELRAPSSTCRKNLLRLRPRGHGLVREPRPHGKLRARTERHARYSRATSTHTQGDTQQPLAWEPRTPPPRRTRGSHPRGSHAHPRPGGRAAATPAGAGAQRHSAYHEVLDAVAELVDEEDREVVHRLPQLDPGGEAVLHVAVRPRLRGTTCSPRTLRLPENPAPRTSGCFWSRPQSARPPRDERRPGPQARLRPL